MCLNFWKLSALICKPHLQWEQGDMDGTNYAYIVVLVLGFT